MPISKSNPSEHKRRISIALSGSKRPWASEVSKRPEVRKKLSLQKLGSKNPMYGRKGILHPNWKGGYENKLWYNRQRRNKKTQNGGSYTLGEWELLKKQYGYICPCCKKSEPEIKLTEDHIIPLLKGGSSNIENIQPLCMSCNSKKHTKIIKYKNEK